MRHTRFLLLLVPLAAVLLAVSGCHPSPPKETVLQFGAHHRVLQRPDVRGAERWIFQHCEGSNSWVILEAIVEGRQITGAMQGAHFSYGWCGTGSGGTDYFQHGHLGNAAFLRIDMRRSRMTVNDVACPEEDAERFMYRLARDGQMVLYRFDVPARAAKILDVFAALATNGAGRIVLIPEAGPFDGLPVKEITRIREIVD